MAAFDTPSREICTIQRQRTNTPMQSLVTLNDVQFVEASRFFAQRVLLTGPKDFPGQVNRAFELATGRPADDLRQQVMKKAYDKQKAVFEQNPAQADQLLAMGDSPPGEIHRCQGTCHLDGTCFYDPQPGRNFKPRIRRTENIMNPLELHQTFTRRQMLRLGAMGMGTMGFANIAAPLIGAVGKSGSVPLNGTLRRTHFKPTAKRVIYMFMSGGPSHIDMFDYHPKLREYHGQELPDSIRNGQRITGMTSKQSSFPAWLQCLNLPSMDRMGPGSARSFPTPPPLPMISA